MTNFSFSLRSYFAATAGLAFLAVVASWIISWCGEPTDVYLFMTPLAVGAFSGIFIAGRNRLSSLCGAILGGLVGMAFYPGWDWWRFGGIQCLGKHWHTFALGVGISASLAAVVGVLREGITLYRRRP